MSVQYISDEQGRPTAVIIPIEDWNRLTAKYKDFGALEKPARKPSDFVGSLSKEAARRMIADTNRSRSEWERDT